MSIAITFLVLIIISYVVYRLIQPEKQEIDLINSVIYKIQGANNYQIKNFGSSYSDYIYIPKYKNYDMEIQIDKIFNRVIIGDITLSRAGTRLFKKEFKKVAIQINMSKLIN